MAVDPEGSGTLIIFDRDDSASETAGTGGDDAEALIARLGAAGVAMLLAQEREYLTSQAEVKRTEAISAADRIMRFFGPLHTSMRGAPTEAYRRIVEEAHSLKASIEAARGGYEFAVELSESARHVLPEAPDLVKLHEVERLMPVSLLKLTIPPQPQIVCNEDFVMPITDFAKALNRGSKLSVWGVGESQPIYEKRYEDVLADSLFLGKRTLGN